MSSDNQELERLTTRLTHKQLVHFDLPKEMNKTDFELLAQWISQLRKAYFYQPQEDESKSNSGDDVSVEALYEEFLEKWNWSLHIR